LLLIDVYLISIPASWLARRSCQSKSFSPSNPFPPRLYSYLSLRFSSYF